jgi:sodium-dependent dicarboxylate transporter 2/3/5
MREGEAAGDDERLSDGELRFERWRRRLGLWLGPVALVAIAAVDPDDKSQRLAALMAFAAIWWLGEPVPAAVTAFVATALAILLGIAPPKEVFAAFGSPLLFLFVGSFFIAEAMRIHGLGARLARAMARRARTRLSLLMALSATAFGLSLWMSNAAATAVCLPIAVSVAGAQRDRRYAAALVLAIAYGASVGGIGTPVGTPPNLIGIQRLRDGGVDLSFVRFMAIGLPIGLVMLGVLWAVLAWRFDLRRGHGLGFPGAPDDAAAARPPGSAPWNRGEVAAMVALGVAILGWLGPGIVDAAWPTSRAATWLHAHVSEEVVALLAAALLFVWPVAPAGPSEVGPRMALSWSEAARIDWGTIMLFAGGIVLGDLAGKTGLTAAWGRALVDATGAHSLWTLTALVTAIAVVLSEATSNTATANLMVPLTVGIATSAGVPIVPPVLGATLGASFGFMLPISTAPNAMAYGTGVVTVRQMMGAGITFDLLGYLAIVAGLRVLCPLLDLG